MIKKTSLWQRLKDVFTPAETSSKPSNSPNENQIPFAKDVTGQVIADLTQHSLEKNDDIPTQDLSITVDDIDVMLASMGYHFSYHPPKNFDDVDKKANNPQSPVHHFTMQISDGQVSDGERDWGCLLRYFEKEQLLAVYSIFPFSVPESHRGEMLAVMAYLNYDLVIGNLELDVQDGEVRFKTSLDLEVIGLTEIILSYLLQSNFAVTTRLYDTLAEVIAKPTSAETASEAVDSWLANQQANTFYLMTDTFQ